jgi:SAM-dependent methyltransferase
MTTHVQLPVAVGTATAAVPDNLYRAYDRVPADHRERTARLERALDDLLAESRGAESGLLREMKPTIAISLKWRFDHLAKIYASPFELEDDVAYWRQVVSTLADLGRQGWFEMPGASAAPDAWKRTAHGFDIGWTTTTREERFQASRRIAEDRMAQLLEMLGGSDYFRGRDVLDSGCGPGRYVDIVRRLGAKRIVAMDQGARLVSALQERFAGDDVVEVQRGTCERLEYPDDAFDFVFSNGVLHHTPSSIPQMLADHARVLRPGGAMFIMLVGKGGLELKLWEFLRGFLYDVPIETMLERFEPIMSPLRLQGIVDHMYGEYQQTGRDQFEGWCRPLFTRVERVPGIPGLDVTPEIYRDDPYYTARFGSGHLRYLCYK